MTRGVGAIFGIAVGFLDEQGAFQAKHLTQRNVSLEIAERIINRVRALSGWKILQDAENFFFARVNLKDGDNPSNILFEIISEPAP